MNPKDKLLSLTLSLVDNVWAWNGKENFFENDSDESKDLNHDALISFLIEIGLVSMSATCSSCQTTLNRLMRLCDRHPFFRCTKNSCSRVWISAVKNTIFEYTKLSFKDLIKLIFNFACRRSLGDSAETLNTSKKTVIDVYKFFRSAIFSFFEDRSVRLGGNGIVIHFYETPITHRHGNLGRNMRLHTVWVVGAVEIYSRSCFLKFLPSRSRADIYSFLNQWILPGSTINTDYHRSYATLSSFGFTHFSVNHSENLVSTGGTHTNWIEGLFGCVKKMIRKYDVGFTTVSNLELYLAEFCFRYSFGVFDRRYAFQKIVFVLKKTKEKLDEQELIR